MAFDARVYRVLIASPSDVTSERDVVVRVIQEWNDANSLERRVALLPLRWETHTAPELGKPQEIINRQVVDHCDLLIGVFWTRIGTATEAADSGTLEEIERVAGQKKPVMLYFSKIKQSPHEIDPDQFKKLKSFKQKIQSIAFVEHFSEQGEFRDKLSRHLTMQVTQLMGSASLSGPLNKPATDIKLAFADSLEQNSGTIVHIKTQFLKVMDFDEIPDYAPASRNAPLGLLSTSFNRNYYRDFVNQVVRRSLFAPLRFWLTNEGSVGARDIHVHLAFKSDADFLLGSVSELFSANLPRYGYYNALAGPTENAPPAQNVNLPQGSKSWESSLEIAALQPKRELAPPSTIALGVLKSSDVEIHARVYADLLATPQEHHLKASFEAETLEVKAADIIKALESPAPFG